MFPIYTPIVGKGSLGRGPLKSLIITNPYDIIYGCALSHPIDD